MDERTNMPPQPFQSLPPEMPGRIVDLKMIRQMANKIYGEGIRDAPLLGPPYDGPQENIWQADAESTSNKPYTLPAAAAAAGIPVGVGAAQATNWLAPENALTKPGMPGDWTLPVNPNLYFLPNPAVSYPSALFRQRFFGSDRENLRGEQGLMSHQMPPLRNPRTAEQMIKPAGGPMNHRERTQGFGQASRAREPYHGHPAWSGQQGQPELEQNYYTHHFPAPLPGIQEYYFQPHSETRPAGTYSPESARKASRPGQKEVDWAAYRMFNPEEIRQDFPALHQTVNGKPLVWLDNAATTHKPQTVIDALSRFYARDNSNIHRGAHSLAARATDAYEQAREKIRQFIGASSKDEIVYVRGATEGVNLIANTFGRQRVGPGDEIILSELEHHANIVPWQMLAKEKGARLRVIPMDSNGDLMLGEYEQLFGARTRLVALSHVSNALGTVVPVEEMISAAHRRGVPVVVDGAQSVQHMPINVQAMDADFFVFSGHKLFAPTGIGAIYGKKEYLDQMSPWQGGGNMIDRVTFEETTYSPVPAKFEAGTPSIGDAIGLGAAIDYVQQIGLENICRYENELMECLVESLSDIPGLRLIGNPKYRAGAVSFVLPRLPNPIIGQLLDREGIAVRTGHHCAQPALRRFGLESSVRPSLAFYNTKGDIKRLIEALRKL